LQPHNDDSVLTAVPRTPSPEARAAAEPLKSSDHSHVPVHSNSGTGGRLLILILLLVAGLVAAFIFRHVRNARAEVSLSHQTAQSAEAPPSVDVVRVSYGSPTHLLTLPGETRAWYKSTIYARISGYVKNWTGDIGDRVKEGQVLATIDTPELQDQLKAAQAKVAADLSEVRVAEATEKFDKSTNKKFSGAGQGVVSDLEREEKQAETDTSIAKYDAAMSQVNLDQADVNRLKDMEKFENVVAPYDGVILQRHIDIGDLVTAGSTANTTSLYVVAKSDQIRIITDVPQTASNEIKVGMPATASAREFPGRTFRGTVTRTSSSIDTVSMTLEVEVDVPNPNLELVPGMYVQVSFQTKAAHAPLQIPASAINFRTGGPLVAVVDSRGMVHFHNVTISRDMGDVIELGSGVSPGDRVALNISNQVSEGDKVDPIATAAGEEPQSPATSGQAVASKAD
jgi:RND family efflux transporter MFP subunit